MKRRYKFDYYHTFKGMCVNKKNRLRKQLKTKINNIINKSL